MSFHGRHGISRGVEQQTSQAPAEVSQTRSSDLMLVFTSGLCEPKGSKVNSHNKEMSLSQYTTTSTNRAAAHHTRCCINKQVFVKSLEGSYQLLQPHKRDKPKGGDSKTQTSGFFERKYCVNAASSGLSGQEDPNPQTPRRKACLALERVWGASAAGRTGLLSVWLKVPFRTVSWIRGDNLGGREEKQTKQSSLFSDRVYSFVCVVQERQGTSWTWEGEQTASHRAMDRSAGDRLIEQFSSWWGRRDLLQTYHPTPQTGNPKKLASLRWVTPDELRQGVYGRRVLLTDKDSSQPAHALEVLTLRKTLARRTVLTDASLRADKQVSDLSTV
ncbi:hypothetical protein RRG08_066717 [Elysia crispata]|uniref:Uncharacterized protein n=1 Tax=Elysia crispata TaxID=231223 RepID=A0AAE1EC44_9GAST|nr:hypothetical protein RRG08_066717 [Elysia crispata]